MKIGQILNIDSVKGFLDSYKKVPGFTDAAIGVVLARNLTQVDPTIFEMRYPELTFLNSGITVDNSGGYARKIQSLRVIEQGGFTVAGDKSGNKGRISLTAEDTFLTVVEKETEVKWTDSDAKEAELQNINLVSRYLQAVDSVYKREIDYAGYVGIPGITGSYGLLNHTGFTAAVATNGAISVSTAALDDYNTFVTAINAQRSAVNNTPEYTANRVDMPVSVMNIIGVKILNTANASNVTVLQALKAAFPDITFSATFRAESVSGTKRATIYSNRPEVSKFRMPVPLTIGEILKLGSFDYKSDAKYRLGGLDLLTPAGGRIITGL